MAPSRQQPVAQRIDGVQEQLVHAPSTVTRPAPQRRGRAVAAFDPDRALRAPLVRRPPAAWRCRPARRPWPTCAVRSSPRPAASAGCSMMRGASVERMRLQCLARDAPPRRCGRSPCDAATSSPSRRDRLAQRTRPARRRRGSHRRRAAPARSVNSKPAAASSPPARAARASPGAPRPAACRRRCVRWSMPSRLVSVRIDFRQHADRQDHVGHGARGLAGEVAEGHDLRAAFSAFSAAARRRNPGPARCRRCT